MKSPANRNSFGYLPFDRSPVYGAATADFAHETEVIRGVMLAAPLALLLWVPLIATAVHLL